MAKASYLLARLQPDRDRQRALPLLAQAAEHDPGDHDKHNMLGKTSRRTGDQQAGLDALRRRLRIKPGRNYIELELCAALIEADHGDEAADHLRRGERGVRGWLAWKAAWLAFTLGQVPDARRLLAQAGRERWPGTTTSTRSSRLSSTPKASRRLVARRRRSCHNERRIG